MNRVKKVSKKWLRVRPYATQIADENRRKRNERRQPKPRKDPNKI